jgi:hypothetical protein
MKLYAPLDPFVRALGQKFTIAVPTLQCRIGSLMVKPRSFFVGNHIGDCHSHWPHGHRVGPHMVEDYGLPMPINCMHIASLLLDSKYQRTRSPRFMVSSGKLPRSNHGSRAARFVPGKHDDKSDCNCFHSLDADFLILSAVSRRTHHSNSAQVICALGFVSVSNLPLDRPDEAKRPISELQGYLPDSTS